MENEWDIVEEVFGNDVLNTVSCVDELPYMIHMDAIFGKKADYDRVLKARDVLVECIMDTLEDLKRINKIDLMEARLEHLESIVEEQENDRKKAV